MSRDADLATLRALNARFIHNYVTNDVARHDAILHGEFICMRTNGARIARAPYLVAWATGFDPDVVIYWDMRDEAITLVGDTALVRATNKHTIVAGGRATTGMTTYTDTYVREVGRWLCLQAQLTEVAPSAYPCDDTIVVTYVRGVRDRPME